MSDPMALDLGLGPAPTAPEPPQPTSRTPSGNQRLIQLALMGLAGGLGPGAGTGILQGMAGAMQRRRQDAAQQDAFNQQSYARQQQEYAATMRAYEVEQQRREQVLQKNLQDFRTVAPTLPDKGTYDRYVDAYTQGLQALGFRLSPNWLRSAVPYSAPSAKDVAAKALDAFMKNPLNKSVVDNPDKLQGAFLTFDRDGDGVPERVPFFEAAELAQMPVAKDASGKLLAMPKGTTPEVKANADGILQSLIEQDRAEGKPDTPQRRVELQKQAIRMAKDAGDTTPNGGGSAPTVGSFEDYVRRAYGPNPTAQQIEAARRAYFSSDDRPVQPKEPTEGERKAAGFYGQMESAIKTMDALESTLTDKELYQIQSLPQEGLIGAMNRGQLSENAKRYIRALEQFTESRLRPVSGAAIADSEYERDRRTYARQFGETPKLAADRKAARRQALQSLRTMAGRAVGTPSPADEPDPVGASALDVLDRRRQRPTVGRRRDGARTDTAE